MTKQELMTVVSRVYSLWNQEIPVAGQKDLFEAWWLLLWDLEAQQCLDAVVGLAALDGYMPRPGTVRRTVLDRQGVAQPPLPIEAWTQVRRLSESVGAGTFRPVELHPTVAETVRRIGSDLHTNGDREQFIRLYEKLCVDWQHTTYTPPTPT